MWTNLRITTLPRLLLVACVLMPLACGPRSRTAVQSIPPTVQCGSGRFPNTPWEHMVVELKETFRVRELAGTARSAVGEWPDGIVVTVQVRRRDSNDPVASTTTTDIEGTFRLSNVGAGEYCFKASALGWQSVHGTIVVSPDATPAVKVEFVMPLGV
jgi:hypothetical protein